MKPADEERELTRLLAEDSLPRSLVAGLRGRSPDATELASLASRLAMQGIDVTPRPSGAGPAPWKKWVAAGGGSLAVAVAWLALRGPAGVPQTPATAAVPSAALTNPSPTGTPAPSSNGAIGAVKADSVAPPAGAMAQSQKSAAAVEATPAAEAAPALEPPASEPGSSVPAARTLAEAPPPEPSRPRESSTPLAPSRAAVSKGSDPGSTTPVDSQPAGAPTEIELLRDARLALRQSPARALELAEQHARLYPGGKLTQEREVLAISALVALGRRTGALDRAARFDAAFPTSPYRKQVADLLR